MFSFHNLVFIILTISILAALKFKLFKESKDLWFLGLNLGFPLVLITWNLDTSVRWILVFNLLASAICFFKFKENYHYRILINFISFCLLFIFPLEYLSQETYLALTLIVANFLVQGFSYLTTYAYFGSLLLLLWSVFEIGL